MLDLHCLPHYFKITHVDKYNVCALDQSRPNYFEAVLNIKVVLWTRVPLITRCIWLH